MIRLSRAAVVLTAVLMLNAQEPQNVRPGSLTLEDVMGFSKAGMPDDLIVARVKANAKAFDLNADEIQELRKSGVTDTVVKYLLDPALPYSRLVAPPPAAPTGVFSPTVAPPKLPSDPLALKVPPEVGIYYLTGKGEFLALDLKAVVPSKQPGKLSALSGGLLKGHTIGSLIGPSSRARTGRGAATFFVRLEGKTAVQDLALLNLELSENRRDLDFGTKPSQQVFPLKSVRSFESNEVATGIFRLQALLNGGEYLFFLLGSGDEKKGLLGRGYDFGVD